jgi:ABC-type uncharacterized transport system substrate-binding protein
MGQGLANKIDKLGKPLLNSRCNRLLSGLRCLIVTALYLVSIASYSADEIHFIVSSDAAYYTKALDLLTSRLSEDMPERVVTQTFLSEQKVRVETSDNQLLVTIGTQAANYAVEHYPQNPLLALFITRQSWAEAEDNRPSNNRRAAIIAEQPLNRYLALVGFLVPEATVYSTAFGPSSVGYKEIMESEVAASGRQLMSATVAIDSNPVALLSPLFEQSDAFVALPDEAVINRNMAKWILHLGHQQKIPVFGFSASYTRVGALASLYSSPENIAMGGYDWLKAYFTGQSAIRWGIIKPDYFTVTTNPSVARALGIQLPQQSEISAAVDVVQGESEP